MKEKLLTCKDNFRNEDLEIAMIDVIHVKFIHLPILIFKKFIETSV